MKKIINVGIIGAGSIARQHLKVINKISGFKLIAITSRTNSKAKKVAAKFKIKNINKNLNDLNLKNKLDCVLIFVSAENMYSTIQKVIKFKIPFFFEKPAGLNFNETKNLANLASKFKVKNMVGLNRRFYSVFNKGKQFLEKNGGIKGFLIEGHERFWKVKKNRNKKVLNNWIYANSIHTIDLIRYFGGDIKKFKSFSNNNGLYKNFSISSKFKNNIIGTYISNWDSPGGWSVTLFGKRYTINYKPLETGIITNQKFKSKKITPDKFDKRFKPGFYRQMLCFKNLILKGTLEKPGQSLNDLVKTTLLIKNI